MMGLLRTGTLIFLGYIIWTYVQLSKDPPLPVIDENNWWGPECQGECDTSIRPFKINIPDKDIKDLKRRLSLPYRLTSPLDGANFTYGFNSETLRVILDYWRDSYDWRKRETRLNAFPQFLTQIEGLDIHFLHVKPKVDESKYEVVPLLMIHGWPGSFVEFDEILPLLTSPREGSDVVFEVVCPSLPGYGFSQGASKQGLGVLETGQIFLKLMKRLGFELFYLQGGDWGALVSTTITTMYPDNVIGMHTNLPVVMTTGTQFKQFLGSVLPSGWVMYKEDEPFLYPLGEKLSYIMREMGYAHIQATKPDTIGAALSDSPVGLSAYILEKFSSWTRRENPSKADGGLLSQDFPISLDRLLDNVSLYWFSNSMTTSVRYYAESFVRVFSSRINEITTAVPSAFSAFPNEIQCIPENLAAHKFKNIIFYRRHKEGGHFPAMEIPEVLAKDVFDFVAEVHRDRRQKQKVEL